MEIRGSVTWAHMTQKYATFCSFLGCITRIKIKNYFKNKSTDCEDGYYYYFFKPTSTKPQAEILKLNNVNSCNDISFGDHSILEGDRIPPLKSHGQALEEELCFPGVLSDNRDVPANLLRHFYGCYYYYYQRK